LKAEEMAIQLLERGPRVSSIPKNCTNAFPFFKKEKCEEYSKNILRKILTIY
jgi:hypothetical protein